MNTYKVIFLGTGVSTAVPSLYHIVVCADAKDNECKVCKDAFHVKESKNKRNNVSIALQYQDPKSGDAKCVVIDVGKTMRDSLMATLPRNNIKFVNSIILTHGHADACLGLDDVRDLQHCTQVSVADPKNPGSYIKGQKVESGPIEVFLHQETFDQVKKQFSYLVDPPPYLDAKNYILERRTALLEFTVIDPNSSFITHGMPVRSFPVYHGGTYISLGFSFGLEGEFVYISDVKIIPDNTMGYLKSIPKIKTLVLDCLAMDGIFGHIGLHEALDFAKILNPEKLYLVGMSCDIGMHDETNEMLKSLRPNTELAYDGLVLDGFKLV